MANDEANIRALEERIGNLELHNRQQEPQFYTGQEQQGDIRVVLLEVGLEDLPAGGLEV